MARRRRKESISEIGLKLVAVVMMWLVFSGTITGQDILYLALVLIAVAVGVILTVIWWRKRSQSHNAKTVHSNQARQSSPQIEPHPEKLATQAPVSPSQPVRGMQVGRDGEWSLSLLQRLEWRVFEKLVVDYFAARGMPAQLTSNGADGGVDITVTSATTNLHHTIYVQCKAWKKQPVGVKPVRELYGVMAADKASLGWLINTGGFTNDAIQFADSIKELRLIDGRQFLKMIGKLSPEQQAGLLRKATAGDYTTPTCPSCDVKMVERRGKQVGAKPFWGCRSFPRCRQTMKMANSLKASRGKGNPSID